VGRIEHWLLIKPPDGVSALQITKASTSHLKTAAAAGRTITVSRQSSWGLSFNTFLPFSLYLSVLPALLFLHLLLFLPSLLFLSFLLSFLVCFLTFLSCLFFFPFLLSFLVCFLPFILPFSLAFSSSLSCFLAFLNFLIFLESLQYSFSVSGVRCEVFIDDLSDIFAYITF